MSWTLITARRMMVVGGALILGAGFALSANSQTAPAAAPPADAPPATAPPAGGAAAGPSAARKAIEVRQAVYTLIGNNFRPLGEVLKGNAQYDAAEAEKRIVRVAFLTGLLNEAFPDVSNIGEPDTKAKADIWTNRADFDKKLNDFQVHVTELVQVNAMEKGATDVFRAALGAVAQDCKGCHDSYRTK
jgi:cytochrome c556